VIKRMLDRVLAGFFTGITGLVRLQAVVQAVLNSGPKGTEELIGVRGGRGMIMAANIRP